MSKSLDAGVLLKMVSERLGHSAITITADTYAHVTERLTREAPDKLREAFRKQSDS